MAAEDKPESALILPRGGGHERPIGCSPGVRGLFRLDGSRLRHVDLVSMGIPLAYDQQVAAVDATDPLEPDAVHVLRENHAFGVLIGGIDDQEALATALGLGADIDAVRLARSASARFGADLPSKMLGDWLFVDWCDRTRRLTIAKSINPSYPLLVARRGADLAIASDLPSLARLGWVDAEPDPLRFAASVASFRMRAQVAGETMLRGVTAIHSGRVATFDAAGENIAMVDPCLPTHPWTGGFDDAVTAAEHCVRSIVRDRIRRTPSIGLTLSGGLDSSLLAWVIAVEHGGARPSPFFSSAVAADSGLDDEVPFAGVVTDHLGQLLVPTVPPDSSPFLPAVGDFLASARPTRLPFLHLNRAFGERAAALGVSHLLYGVMGEMTVTASGLVSNRLTQFRKVASVFRAHLREPDLRERWPDSAFATWLAPRILDKLPSDWIASRRLKPEPWRKRSADDAWGYPPSLPQLLERDQHDTITGVVRSHTPLTDIRLLRLFASFPAAFADHAGIDRAVGRAMLRDRLPEAIRLRAKGPAFAPDFHRRLRRHAAGAKARIPLFRRIGIGDWIDLDRLEASLDAVHLLDRRHRATVFKTQFGMQIAEYLFWWRSGRPGLSAAGRG